MFAVPPPPASFWLKLALVTWTSWPVCVQVPFQPPPLVCQVVGQVNVNVQPSSGFWSLLVMSMLPTKPLPQSAVSAKWTEQVLVAGAPVVTVSGGDAQETLPAPSLARTLTVVRLPGTRFWTVKEVSGVSPSCSLV